MDLDFPGPQYTTFVLTVKQKEGVKKKKEQKRGFKKRYLVGFNMLRGRGFGRFVGFLVLFWP